MKRRKVLAVTGARSEYDLMYSVYRALDLDQRFDFSIIVTGPHLSERFGLTVQQVEKDGFHIEDRIFNLIDSNQKIGRIVSIGNQIPALASTFYRCQPDLILVAGDREESISTTMIGAYMDIPVAHFFGGDIAKDGNIDNSVRYAAGKFAHLHFTTLPAHRENLIRMGEDDWRIHVVGNPGLDRFLSTPTLDRSELFRRLYFPDHGKPFFVLIQHSIITEFEKQSEHIRITLEAIRSYGVQTFINYPNSDAGNYEIIEAYHEYEAAYPDIFKTFKNLDRDTYINLLRHASLLLGNSSSGLLEAPSLGLPAINIGPRQRGRIHGANVLFVDNELKEIENAIDFALNNTGFKTELAKKQNPYGNGHSTELVVKALSEVVLNDVLIHKNITY